MNPLDLVDYCIKYGEGIFVREQLEGKWGSYSLGQLPGALALAHVRRWMAEGRTPVRIIASDEPEVAAEAVSNYNNRKDE